MAITFEQFQQKLVKWARRYPSDMQYGFKKLTSDIHGIIKQLYLTKVHKTGDSARSIEVEISKGKKIGFRVFFGKKFDRKYIAYFHELGTRKMRARPIWGPTRRKHRRRIIIRALAELINSYKKVTV